MTPDIHHTVGGVPLADERPATRPMGPRPVTSDTVLDALDSGCPLRLRDGRTVRGEILWSRQRIASLEARWARAMEAKP